MNALPERRTPRSPLYAQRQQDAKPAKKKPAKKAAKKATAKESES